LNLQYLKAQKELYLQYAEQACLAGVPEVEQDWFDAAATTQQQIDKILWEAAEEHNTWREKFHGDLQSGRYRR
jgi:hypothetical protein